MWFHKATKQAFIFPTKTGSASARSFLDKSGWKCLAYQAEIPANLIAQYPNLATYSIYGFLRDPLKRFESSVLHIKQVSIYKNLFDKFLADKSRTREFISYEEVIAFMPQLSLLTWANVFFWPQSYWFEAPNVTILDFDNIEAELRRITGNTTEPFEALNASTDFGRSEITQAVRDFVREHYAADYALAKDRLGKEY
jgi:hypothetical protein